MRVKLSPALTQIGPGFDQHSVMAPSTRRLIRGPSGGGGGGGGGRKWSLLAAQWGLILGKFNWIQTRRVSDKNRPAPEL